MNAPGHGKQPSSPCPNCSRSNCWYEPGLNLWTNTFEPLEDFFARRFDKAEEGA